MLSQAAEKDPAMSGQLSYERVEGDFYPTPPENVDCLAAFFDLSDAFIWEPACGEGHISKRLLDFAKGVVSTDLFDRGYGTAGHDFLRKGLLPTRINGIITNPPFGDVAEQFIRHALFLTQATSGFVAMFLRNEYDMASTGRVDLFEGHPAYLMKICVTKRPRWIEGSKGSPRHSYSWYIWDWSKDPETLPVVRYIHPKLAKAKIS